MAAAAARSRVARLVWRRIFRSKFWELDMMTGPSVWPGQEVVAMCLEIAAGLDADDEMDAGMLRLLSLVLGLVQGVESTPSLLQSGSAISSIGVRYASLFF